MKNLKYSNNVNKRQAIYDSRQTLLQLLIVYHISQGSLKMIESIIMSSSPTFPRKNASFKIFEFL